MAASFLALGSLLLLAVALTSAGHHHHHHYKTADELDLNPTERRIKENLDNFLEEGWKKPFDWRAKYTPPYPTRGCNDPNYDGTGCCLQLVEIDIKKLHLKKEIEPVLPHAWACQTGSKGFCLKENPILGGEPEIEGECRPASYNAMMVAFTDDNGRYANRLVPSTIVRSCACF